MKAKLLCAAAALAALTACGTEPQDRVGGGAAAGAATGAGVGALGGPVGALGGAAIGGGAGAATGALTEPDQVNLGRPPWNNPEVRTPEMGSSGYSGAQYTSGEDRRTGRRASRQPRDERDRAYMGGGMVVEPGSPMYRSMTGRSGTGGTTSGSGSMDRGMRRGGGGAAPQPHMTDEGATLEQNPDSSKDSSQ